MPIDFKQIAAPSFSDSNTLVALAAKQQEEAMAGIQGAWTGAMDAVQNNVQGELKNRINMADYNDLTDPTKRAALNADMLAFNEKNLGMADMDVMATYVDGRIPITMANQTGKLAYNEAIKSANYLEGERESVIEERNLESVTGELSSRILMLDQQIREHGSPEDNPDYDIDYISRLQQEREMALQTSRGNSKVEVGVFNALSAARKEEELYNQKFLGGDLKNMYSQGAIDKQAVVTGKLLADMTGMPEKERNEAMGVVWDQLAPGAYNKASGTMDWGVAKSGMYNAMDMAIDSVNDPTANDDENFDQYLMTNRESVLGGELNSQELESLQAVFRDYENNGMGFTDREKKQILNGFVTGSLAKNKFVDFWGGIRENYLKRSIRDNFLKDATSAHERTMASSIRKAAEPYVTAAAQSNVGPEEFLLQMQMGKDSPYMKYMPSKIQKAAGYVAGKERETWLDTSETSVDLTGRQKLDDLTQKDAMSSLLQGTTTNTPGSGVLAAVGKANNVGKAASDIPASTPYTPSNQKGNIKNLVTSSGKVIPRDKVTPQMAKEANVKMRNGRLVWEDRFKGEKMKTKYGETITINSVEDLERFIQVNYSSHVKEVDNVLANNGKAKYRYPDDLSKIDKNHPLAHPDSDNPKNFVPYDQRNYDGSRKAKPSFKYSGYDTYVRLTLNKELGRKNK